jgi:hypothetical protein
VLVVREQVGRRTGQSGLGVRFLEDSVAVEKLGAAKNDARAVAEYCCARDNPGLSSA